MIYHHRVAILTPVPGVSRGIALLFFLASSIACGQVGLTFGTEYGMGVLARLGPSAAKVEFGGGVAPLLFLASFSNGENTLRLYMPGTVGGKVNFRVNDSDLEDRLGIDVGVSYNTLLGIGIGGGGDIQLGGHPMFLIGAGVMIYPNAREGLLDRFNEDENTRYTDSQFSAPFAVFQPFLSASILF